MRRFGIVTTRHFGVHIATPLYRARGNTVAKYANVLRETVVRARRMDSTKPGRGAVIGIYAPLTNFYFHTRPTPFSTDSARGLVPWDRLPTSQRSIPCFPLSDTHAISPLIVGR